VENLWISRHMLIDDKLAYSDIAVSNLKASFKVGTKSQKKTARFSP